MCSRAHNRADPGGITISSWEPREGANLREVYMTCPIYDTSYIDERHRSCGIPDNGTGAPGISVSTAWSPCGFP